MDEKILKYLSKGDEKGIELIITYYGGLLRSVVRKHLYSLQAYEGECLNDTLLAIWNNWQSYDASRGTLKSWICAIARYRSINYLKKHAKELDHVEFEEIAPYLISQEDGPLSQEIWQIELNQLLQPLSLQDRQLFIELFSQEQSIEDVSKRYDISKDNLYQRISRGRKKLRERRNQNGLL